MNKPILDTDRDRERAIALARTRDYSLLKPLCQEILKDKPKDLFANVNYAVILASEGKYLEAISRVDVVVKADPKNVLALANKAMYLCELRMWKEAAQAAEQALKLDPKNVNAFLNHTWACNSLSRFSDAEKSARKALAIDPKNAKLLNNLASALKSQSKVREAVEIYKGLVKDYPDFDLGYGNLLLAYQYDPDVQIQEISQAAKSAGRLLVKNAANDPLTVQPASSKPLRTIANRRIRIGFISPDINDHAVAYFFEPLFYNLNPDVFERYIFFTQNVGDFVTERVMKVADHFKGIGGLKPRLQAEEIAKHDLDLLIDLAGHTAKTGLAAMAYKPAFLQATWMGYPGTTGLETIDARFTDTYSDANVSKGEYTEDLMYLPPPFCCYRPAIRQPLKRYWRKFAVKPTPAKANGYLTFGSCNNIAKLNDETLKVWLKILRLHPKSKLLIEGKSLDDPLILKPFTKRLVGLGYKENELIFVTRETRNQYLTYDKIDIALDPFPLTGGTTSADLIWYGVPVVTFAGKTFRGRMTASFLTSIGLTRWIANSEEEYILAAKKMAADIDRLDGFRQKMRALVEKSRMCNEMLFAYEFSVRILQLLQQKGCVIEDFTKLKSQIAHPEQAGYVIPFKERKLRLTELPVTYMHLAKARNFSTLRDLAVVVLEYFHNEKLSLFVLSECERNDGNLENAEDYALAARSDQRLTEEFKRNFAATLRGQNAPATS